MRASRTSGRRAPAAPIRSRARRCLRPVVVVERGPPRRERGIAGADHDIADGQVGVDPFGEGRADVTDPATERRRRRPGRSSRRGPRPPPRVGHRYVLATARRVVLPAPFGPTMTQRSPADTVQSIESRIQRPADDPSRRTPTPASPGSGRRLRATRRTARPARDRPSRRRRRCSPASCRIQGFSSRGRVPELLVEEVDPAAGDTIDVVDRGSGRRRRPSARRPVRSCDRRCRAATVELAARIEEVDRLVGLRDRPARLGEEVEPGRIEAAAERAGAPRTGPGRRGRPSRRARWTSRISRSSPAIRSIRAPIGVRSR